MEINDEKQLISKVVDLAYKVLYKIIPVEELDKEDAKIKLEVMNLLNDEADFKFSLAFDRKIMNEKLLEGKNFDLMEFLNKPDYNYEFPYKCPYNKKSGKAALGCINKNEAIYCEVPPHSNHADAITAIHKIVNPNYENLAVYHLKHKDDPNGSDWHSKVMNEEGCIIIHFIPNEYGEALFYIPNEITDFQYQELLKINSMLSEKGIVSETNHNKTLQDYLATQAIEKMEQGIDVLGETTNEIQTNNGMKMGFAKIWILAIVTTIICIGIIVLGFLLG